MRPAALVALLLLGLAQGASGAAAFLEDFNVGDAIKGVPGMMRNNFHTLTTGTQALWRNRKVAAVLRKKHKSEGAMPTYPELLLLRKSADDTQKLIQAGMVYLILPEALPAMLYFFPNCLPSTFESETRRGKRYDTLLRLRTKAVLDLAVLIDSDAAAKTGKTGRLAVERAAEAERVLRASSLPAATAQLARYLPPATSAQVVEVDKAPLKGMPGPFLKAGCTLIGLSGTLPDFIRRRELKKHLRHVRQPHSRTIRRCPLTLASQSRADNSVALPWIMAPVPSSRCPPCPPPSEQPVTPHDPLSLTQGDS